MDPSRFLTGQFLLAMPGIGDPRFEHAVIAMCAHGEGGAIGVGLGATLSGIDFHALLRQLEIEPAGCPNPPIHLGGPVEPRRGFVLHSGDWTGEDTIDVAGRWALSTTLDVLRAIADGTGPARWVVALGYAGWAEGQLDVEMTRHGWLALPGDTELLYDCLPEARWSSGMAGAGIDPRMLVSTSGTA